MPIGPEPWELAPWRNLFAILDADLTSSPQPPHLKEFLAVMANEKEAGEYDDDIGAEEGGGSRLGGVAQEHTVRLPRAQPLASRQTAAAADNA